MDMPLLAVTAGLLAALALACILPLRAEGAEDQGDGRTAVLIPRPVPTSRYRPRTWTFLAIAAALGLVFTGWQRPGLAELYLRAVASVTTAITRDPAGVNGYVARLRPATLFLAVAYIIGISLVTRATPGRRLVMLGHAPLYVAMCLLAHALMIAVGVATGWLVAPFGIEATLVNLLLGGLAVMRLTFTGFVLPRATAVPVNRPWWPWDQALAACALICSVALLIAGYAFASSWGRLTASWQLFLPLYAVSLLFALTFVPLCLLWRLGARPPEPTDERPPVDVLIPAYNEAENVARLLDSIELAVGRYGGPVRVVVSDDGSVDETAQVAADAIARFRHARGEILTGRNGGQSAALNRALAITSAEIVIRIDADCVMGADALVYSVPWFRDPVIGSVGAIEEPRTDTVTWFHRLRTLETLFQFRFARVGQSMVDGVVVIPGTFTAFRRAPALLAGGFPVGMNGEDTDLTMNIGRQGYRVAVDPRIRCYEDVPRSPAEFIEQRTRWARAGFHTYARHDPLRCGSAGPRVWFWTLRRGFSWFSLQAGMVAPVFMLELALTHPTYRDNVGAFALLYVAGSAVPLAISLPLAIRHRHWRSILWMPTWFAYAFLRRLGTLEAAISLPTRPFPAPVRARAPRPARRWQGPAGARDTVIGWPDAGPAAGASPATAAGPAPADG
jgi:cellulose synthase/poly-beta-1,6-N-acetylglucosamine synthase-like glycosyltransferase